MTAAPAEETAEAVTAASAEEETAGAEKGESEAVMAASAEEVVASCPGSRSP